MAHEKEILNFLRTHIINKDPADAFLRILPNEWCALFIHESLKDKRDDILELWRKNLDITEFINQISKLINMKLLCRNTNSYQTSRITSTINCGLSNANMIVEEIKKNDSNNEYSLLRYTDLLSGNVISLESKENDNKKTVSVYINELRYDLKTDTGLILR